MNAIPSESEVLLRYALYAVGFWHLASPLMSRIDWTQDSFITSLIGRGDCVIISSETVPEKDCDNLKELFFTQ